MAKYIKVAAKDRTVIPGMWSDLADVFHASFIEPENGEHGLCVYVKDNTSEPVVQSFTAEPTTFSLASTTTADTNTFAADSGNNIASGDVVRLIDTETGDQQEATVLANVGDVITIDSPLIRPFAPATTTAVRTSDSLLVDGSTSAVIMAVEPATGTQIDVSSMTMEIVSPTSFDFLGFGGLSVLTNGLLLRINNGDGTFTNILNFKDLSELISFSNDHNFLRPTGQVGASGEAFTARIDFGRDKEAIRLDAEQGEKLELVVQDNLTTGNSKIKAKVKGRKV